VLAILPPTAQYVAVAQLLIVAVVELSPEETVIHAPQLEMSGGAHLTETMEAATHQILRIPVQQAPIMLALLQDVQAAVVHLRPLLLGMEPALKGSHLAALAISVPPGLKTLLINITLIRHHMDIFVVIPIAITVVEQAVHLVELFILFIQGAQLIHLLVLAVTLTALLVKLVRAVL
jgi:hypothetical protein